jgi:dTDP-4-dehydrorhamnose 3,5-epimerase-like enzyme
MQKMDGFIGEEKMKIPYLVEGGISIDDRGVVKYINEFNFKAKRLYTVSNFSSLFIRAWHGHKKEEKCVMVLKGAAVVAAIPIEDWAYPRDSKNIYRYVLSDKKPAMVYIPKNCVNGFMSLTDDSQLLFFSSATLEESQEDDYRFEPDFWEWQSVWDVIER